MTAHDGCDGADRGSALIPRGVFHVLGSVRGTNVPTVTIEYPEGENGWALADKAFAALETDGPTHTLATTKIGPGVTVVQPADERREIADMLLETTKFRLQSRVDACLERHGGDANAATTGSGIGISYGFAREIVHALSYAAGVLADLGTDPRDAEIARLREALTKILAEHPVDFGTRYVMSDASNAIGRIMEAARAALAQHEAGAKT